MPTDVLKHLQEPSQLWIAVMAGGGLCSAAYLVRQHMAMSILVAMVSISVIVVAAICSLNATRRLRRQSRKITRLLIRQIKRDNRRLRGISGGFPDLIMVIDEDGRCLELFAGDDNCLEAPQGELLGRTLHDCLTKQSANFITATVKQALDASKVQTVEYPNRAITSIIGSEPPGSAFSTNTESQKARCLPRYPANP